MALAVLCALGGLVAGEWVEALASAAGRHEPLGPPWWACRRCGRALPLRLVPLARSAPGRRCSSCGAVPAHRWRPLVAAAVTGALFSLVATRFGASAPLPAYLVFVTGLVGLSLADLELRLLPVSLLYPTLLATAALLGVASATEGRLASFGAAALWALLVTASLWLVWRLCVRDQRGRIVRHLEPGVTYDERFGFGDVRLAGLVAFGVAWVVPPGRAMIAAALAFLVAGIVFVATYAVRLLVTGNWRARLPFGPFLAAGALWTLVWGSLALAPGGRL